MPLLLNGSAGNYLSTTTTAAVAVGSTFLPLTSTTGLTVGQSVADTTASALSNITKIVTVASGVGVAIWPPVSGVGVGSGDTIVFTGGAVTIDTATAGNSATGRRVLITSAGDDHLLTWTVKGTNAAGYPITDTFAGANGTSYSNLDFVTVTSITPSGTTASTVEAGTNGVGSSPWWTPNWHVQDINLGIGIEIVSGSVNFTLQYTYDDPNNLQAGALFPLAYNDVNIVNYSSSPIDASYAMPITAVRVLINSGTGELRVRYQQAGLG